MGVFTDTGTLSYWNIIAGGKVIGRYEGGTKKYYYKDALGSIRAVVDLTLDVIGVKSQVMEAANSSSSMYKPMDLDALRQIAWVALNPYLWTH